MNSKPFGRRGEALRPLSPAMAPLGAAAQGARAQALDGSLPQSGSLSKELGFSALDDDLKEWKRARKQNFEIPWRPLSLLASVFFGIASFALPDSVNDVVQWPLYGLAAASFWVGFRRRREAKKPG
jgi:hypothetical protein